MKEKTLMFTPYVAVAKSLEAGTILTEQRNGSIVAFLRFSLGKREPIGRLQQVFVVKEHRGNGIGSSLLKDFERLARKHNMARVRVKTALHNIRAQKFYRRHGYVRTGILHKKVEEVVYEKSLTKTNQTPLTTFICARAPPFEAKNKPWMGSFEVSSEEEAVIKQIVHNCNYWNSQICKRETLEKYCREKGVSNPTAILNDLIRRGIVYEPRPGYVGLTEPEKHGLKNG